MDEFMRQGSYGQASVLDRAPAEKLAFLRKVYGLFTGGIVTAAVGALVALYAGANMSQASVEVGNAVVKVPPLVAFFSQHAIIGAILFIGAFFGASAVRQRPGVNVAALFGATFLSGLYLAPMLWFVQLMASQGQTLTASPIRDAFLLTVLGFTGLTTYAMLSKKDFSFLGGFLSMGLWVVIGAGLIAIFVGSNAFALAIASVTILLFGGYILYDTSRMLRDPSNRDPVGAAIGLYLNFMNIFVALLRIFAYSSRRNS
jgi:modulator of FtsH protease